MGAEAVELIQVSKQDLIAYMAQWEVDARCGRLGSREDQVNLPIEEIATRSAEYMWHALGGK